MHEVAAAPTPGVETLLAAIRAGDEPAAADLVRRYEPMLRRLLRVRGRIRWMQGQLGSQDLVQCVFLRAFVALRDREVRFSNSSGLAGFLRTIARNQLRDNIRRLRAARRDRRRTVTGDAAGLDRAADAGQSPSQVAEVHELVARIEGCAPPADLEVLRGRVNGADWKELAAARGTTPEALRLRIQRVRQQIRECLSE